MTRTPSKFLFDHDFAAKAEIKPAIPLALHEAKLVEAEVAGYGRGLAAAKAEILAEAEQRSAAALERIAATLTDVGRGLSGVEARLETEAVDVAVAVGKKLAATLIEREPLAEIAALAMDCFRHLVTAPHVVVRVNDAQHASVGKPIEEMVRARPCQSPGRACRARHSNRRLPHRMGRWRRQPRSQRHRGGDRGSRLPLRQSAACRRGPLETRPGDPTDERH